LELDFRLQRRIGIKSHFPDAMKRTQASGTAMGTAAMRAIESEKPADERICHDPLARRLAGTLFYLLIKLFAGYGERRTHGGLTFIVCRCRYIDDYLRECLNSGTAQVVILGAGLDSRAYREEELKRGRVRTFEVDHPATQASKIGRVKKLFGKTPVNVTYVPVDFNAETLDILPSRGFSRSLKTLFIWEGVTYYLDAEAVDATLAWVRANAAPGSMIIFDYQYQAPALEHLRRDRVYAVLSHLAGERRAFGIERGQIEAFLRRRGFTHVVDADAGQLQRLYCTGPNQGRRVAEIYAIVHAEVGRGRWRLVR
jgi:methyltransferase (TIGR00027 family)